MITKQMVFLVVDDFEPMRKATEHQLQTLGAGEILMAGNGAEALNILQRRKVDVILSDWNMPMMSGLELLKAVRTDDKLRGIPFVLITAEAQRERVAEAIANGVSDLLVKPYNTDSLAARITKAMSRVPTRRNGPAAPAKTPAASAPSKEEAPAATAKKGDRPTILVVDDTPDNLHVLSQLLREDYRVRTVLEGAKALDICCSNQPPDLVLLDVMMPGMDGFAVLEKMRQHPSAEHIPVIFVTAMTSDDARVRGLELGAVDFVAKPIDPDVIRMRVRNFLRYVELHKRLQADYDEMLEAARLREDMEQITHHDMRGPLAGIIGLVQNLADETSGNAGQAERLRLVEESALHILNMLNRSSELYKIETGRFELNAQPVKLDDILQRVADIIQHTFAVRQVTIAIDPKPEAGQKPLLAQADPMLCYSIFHNLLKNACEAAPEGGRVAITLSAQDGVQVSIKNPGAVSQDMRKNFFDKFATNGKPGGTGLGTYSAKLLTQAQGGTIQMSTSDAANETTLVVTLPACPA